MKPRHGEKSKLCYIDTGSFIVYKRRNLRKTEDIYVDIANVVKTRFDTSSYELERPLPRRKIKKLLGK